jgi:hypothetical protein
VETRYRKVQVWWHLESKGPSEDPNKLRTNRSVVQFDDEVPNTAPEVLAAIRATLIGNCPMGDSPVVVAVAPLCNCITPAYPGESFQPCTFRDSGGIRFSMKETQLGGALAIAGMTHMLSDELRGVRSAGSEEDMQLLLKQLRKENHHR